ncbi:PAS domain-containing hybrid sensor histidine kinase/response regulator [Kordiimonas aestuarii]|uniref:PAS domain-containing hybrid sensor histidine kinase/response regulator n=1 Tax=Kordiimonas aestuarii TaxID=1005925 RepID=UPI0021D2D361|nr:PAS domain-containing hybrid sensor histidine kinase/response regulator [Kordiimonas aestuarii]
MLAFCLLPFMMKARVQVFAVVSAGLLLHGALVGGEWQQYLWILNGFFLLLLVFLHQLFERRRASQLERSKAQLDALWATVVDGLIVIDDRARIVSANPATEAIFGYAEDELLDRNVKILMPERYAVEHDGYVGAYNKTGEARIIGIGREVAGRRKDGSEFPLYLAVNQFTADSNVYYGGIVRDMTAETRAKSELVQAKEAAENANRAKTVFLSSISHEVRTPLNAILGFAQLFEIGPSSQLTDRQREYLNHIRSSGEHLLTLINEVLDLSQLECGNLKLSIESVSAGSALAECAEMLAPLADRHKVSIRALPQVDEGLAVRADRVRLKQVITNLLTNAIKYNKAGGSVSFDIDTPVPGTLRITIADTGDGIPEAHWDQLFEPFNRLGREASIIEGTGIGLSVSRTVIEAMGGKIGLSSEIGAGTKFWIDLPAAKSMIRTGSGADVAFEMKIQRRLSPTPTDVATILYIEDNPANTALMRQFLGDIAGINLITVLTAEDGIAVAMDRKIDLILMDLNLPGMDGFEAQIALSANEQTRDIPVIAVSADVNVKTIQRAMNMGFRKFITKPFNLKEAHQAIVSVLPRGSDNVH